MQQQPIDDGAAYVCLLRRLRATDEGHHGGGRCGREHSRRHCQLREGGALGLRVIAGWRTATET